MYLDSGIIVKLLVREPDSQWFERNLLGHNFESSELCLTEVCGALLQKERQSNIGSPERVRAMEKIFSMIEEEMISLLHLDGTLLDRARMIQFACHPQIPLRTLDALHVATCDLNRCGTMAATDRRMRAACKQLGIVMLPAAMEDLPQ
jgi:predicted nucleic acid-binding protein